MSFIPHMEVPEGERGGEEKRERGRGKIRREGGMEKREEGMEEGMTIENFVTCSCNIYLVFKTNSRFRNQTWEWVYNVQLTRWSHQMRFHLHLCKRTCQWLG